MILTALPFIILTAIFWSLVNYIDKYLVNKVVNKNIGSLVLFSGLIGLPVSIVIWFFSKTVVNVAPVEALIAISAGIIFLVSLIPYFKALETESASTVSPMFILIPVFAGALSWVFLNESLSIWQILGGVIIIISTALLTYKKSKKKFRYNFEYNTLRLMVLASFLQAIVTILFKTVSLEEEFWTAAFWENIGLFLAGLGFYIFNDGYRKDFFKVIKKKKIQLTALNINNEIANTAGNLCFRMSFVLIPIALAEVITEALQPFILLLMGIILAKFLPGFSDEKINRQEIINKLKIFSLITLGIIIVNIS